MAQPADRITETVAKLEGNRLLHGLPEERLRALAPVCQERRYLPSDVIFREGDASDGLYLVITGTVKVVTHVSSSDIAVARIGAGETLGEMGVIDGLPRSATAMAQTLVVLLFVPAESFLDLLESAPPLALRIIVMLSERLRRSNRFVAELPGHTVTVTHQDRAE